MMAQMFTRPFVFCVFRKCVNMSSTGGSNASGLLSLVRGPNFHNKPVPSKQKHNRA